LYSVRRVVMANSSSKAWKEFSESAALLERDSETIHDRYRDKWIGIYKGHIEAVADTFDSAIKELARKRIPTTESLVRFIGQKEMTLIL
jgi:hypothetical protein